MITAVVTGDNHLGAYYARLRPDRLERRRRALQEGFRRVVDAAIARRADLFLHVGDLYDRPDPRNAERRFVAEQFARLRDAGIRIFAIAGNHDSPRSAGYDGGVTPHEELEALGAVRLFRATDRWDCETFLLNGQRVCIRGLSSDFNRPPEACPLAELVSQDERQGDIVLTLLHYGVEGWSAFPNEPTLALTNLSRLPADALCVGHLHAPNQTRLGSGGLLLNPGATEHIRFGEERLECGFCVLHCAPGRVEAEFVPLTTQPMQTLELDMTAENPETPNDPEEIALAPGERLRRRLRTRIVEASRAEQLLRVRLRGRLKRAYLADLDPVGLMTVGLEHNFHCQLETNELALYDESENWHLDIGFSFDARQELQSTLATLLPGYADNPYEQEICRLAGREIDAAYERLTGGAR